MNRVADGLGQRPASQVEAHEKEVQGKGVAGNTLARLDKNKGIEWILDGSEAE